MRAKVGTGPPIDVVRMPDGRYMTLDNTRVPAASRTGIEVRAVIHEPTDPFPNGRWTAKSGVEPQTWGEAVDTRIQQQNREYRSRNPRIIYYGLFRVNRNNLLQTSELQNGFTYRHAFLHVVKLELTNLEPWYIIEGAMLRQTISGLRERYPNRDLIPFARRQDNDDIACWESGKNESVFIIHDFAAAGWEQRAQFADFWSWLKQAIEDMIDFDS